MQDEKLNQRHKEILRFILIARLFDFQAYTFCNGLKQEMKFRMNNFTSALNQILTLLKTGLPAEYETYLDNVAADAWEVIEEFDKAEDKAMFLAICRAY